MGAVRVKRRNERTASTQIARLRQQSLEEREDRVAVEEPLEIRLGGKSVAVVMRSPGEDHELAAGFLFTEGILKGKGEVSRIEHCRDPKNPKLCNVINVTPQSGRGSLRARLAAQFRLVIELRPVREAHYRIRASPCTRRGRRLPCLHTRAAEPP